MSDYQDKQEQINNLVSSANKLLSKELRQQNFAQTLTGITYTELKAGRGVTVSDLVDFANFSASQANPAEGIGATSFAQKLLGYRKRGLGVPSAAISDREGLMEEFSQLKEAYGKRMEKHSIGTEEQNLQRESTALAVSAAKRAEPEDVDKQKQLGYALHSLVYAEHRMNGKFPTDRQLDKITSQFSREELEKLAELRRKKGASYSEIEKGTLRKPDTIVAELTARMGIYEGNRERTKKKAPAAEVSVTPSGMDI